MDTSSLSQSRDRREDLLKVADLFFEEARHSPVGPYSGHYISDVGPYDIKDMLDVPYDYARALFAELPAFLKAEWEVYREEQETRQREAELMRDDD